MAKENGCGRAGRYAKRILIGLAVLLVVCVGGFLLWTADYYHASSAAMEILDEEGTLDEGGLIELDPAGGPSSCALIFYPGAKVEAEAYLPLLDGLRDRGITCYLVRMPLNLAIFDMDAAQDVIDAHPEVETWYVGGHSMGGAMASAWASDHEDEVSGLVLTGAYVYGDYPVSRALTVYGSLDATAAEKVDYTQNVVVIEGGNHAQFGDYGRQAGDPDAEISGQEQRAQAIDAIAGFIKGE